MTAGYRRSHIDREKETERESCLLSRHDQIPLTELEKTIKDVLHGSAQVICVLGSSEDDLTRHEDDSIKYIIEDIDTKSGYNVANLHIIVQK